MHEGGEVSRKNPSMVNESELVIKKNKMSTLSSVRKIDKPYIKNEISKVT